MEEGGREGGGAECSLYSFPGACYRLIYFILLLLFFCVCGRINLTPNIFCSPQIRDFSFVVGGRQEGGGGDDDYVKSNSGTSSVVYQSSIAFSIMCIFFTVMYAAFACLIFYNSYALLEESVADARDDGDGDRNKANTAPGYFGGDRFGVVGRTYGDYGRGEKPIEVL